MGYYIETPGTTKGKALYLISTFKAERVNPAWPPPKDKTLICVVENPMFDAVGIVFAEHEYEAWTSPDDFRRKTWLLLPTDVVIKLCPNVAKHLQ